MINQVTNLIQFKNLSKEQQAGFDFEGYYYEVQDESCDWVTAGCGSVGSNVYRLKIQPEKFYYVEESCGEVSKVLKGSDVSPINTWPVFRPATKDEQPKPLSLEDRIKAEFPDKRVVMLGWCDNDILGFGDYSSWGHTRAQSMKNFHKYVYEVEDGSFVDIVGPVLNTTEGVLQPCAVLFSEQP